MKEIKVGIVGLGRLGSVHAQNLAFKIPGCKLVAACSLEQKELDWAKDYLKVEYTTTDYKKMVDEADIEAVVIVSSSPEHCWMIEYDGGILAHFLGGTLKDLLAEGNHGDRV